MYTLNLKEIKKDDILIAGGKGANLGEMLQFNIEVPQGFCITSKAYDDYISQNNLKSVIEQNLDNIYNNENNGERYAKEIQKHISNGNIPKNMENEILSSYRNLGKNIRVAIRSSATAEDLPEASFAGQQETFLNVYKEDDVLDKVKRCWASLWGLRAIMYRKIAGFDKQYISLAIVVQEMINSDVSGVLFTVNPSTNNRKEMMINSSYGLGEAVVSGMVTPDTYLCNRKGKIIDKYVGSKDISIVYDIQKGTRTIDNTKEQRESSSLTKREAEKLVKAAVNIENLYGSPQDIEWTIKDTKLFILQSRSITTLKNKVKENTEKQSKVQRNIINNILEHYPSAPYPLDFEPLMIVSEEKNKVFSQLGINMSNELLMEDNGNIIINEAKVRVSPAIVKIPFIFKDFINEEKNRKYGEEIFENSLNTLDKIDSIDMGKLELSLLKKYLKQLMDISHDISYARFRYYVFPSVVIGKFLMRSLKKIDKSLSEYDLLSGLSYKTWAVNNELIDIANKIKDNKKLCEYILNIVITMSKESIENEYTLIKKNFPDTFNDIKGYLKRNGWKSTMSYLPFSTVSWNEDKSGLMSLLKIMIESQNSNKFETNKYHILKDQIYEKYNEAKGEKLVNQIEYYRYNHVQREESLYLLETCYGISRKIMNEISIRLPNIFTFSEDILYLRINELYELCDNPRKNIDTLMSNISLRKNNRIKCVNKWNSYGLQEEKGDAFLQGISGSRGKVKGKVCVINDVSEFSKLKEGDILVCKFTDPVWTPLFAIASGVISDTGGPLSHSAIVAREYNIPAVLGTGKATEYLSDGDIVIIDGDKGAVSLVDDI